MAWLNTFQMPHEITFLLHRLGPSSVLDDLQVSVRPSVFTSCLWGVMNVYYFVALGRSVSDDQGANVEYGSTSVLVTSDLDCFEQLLSFDQLFPYLIQSIFAWFSFSVFLSSFRETTSNKLCSSQVICNANSIWHDNLTITHRLTRQYIDGCNKQVTFSSSWINWIFHWKLKVSRMSL